ncbi:MAG: hypothetical protein KGR21_09270 [Proteobacteria bacterium]|nr:hypothetical protein [Pseudomonadota bacterium]
MATYGYSAGYQGGGPQAVPSGFIDAYSQAGRNIGAGMQQIGSAIGESLARYGQSKAENEFLTQRLESLAPYLQTVAQSGNVMDARTPEGKLLGDIEKFSSMSIPQKKATLLNAEFYLDRLDKQRARELTDEATRQQLALGQLQLEDILEKRKQQGIITEAIKYGLEQPTTTTQTQQVTDTIEFPPMPGVPTPAVQSTPSQAEAVAARYFMGKYGQAAQDLAKYGTDLGRRAEALNVSPTIAPQPTDTAYKIFGAAFQGLGSPLSIPPTGISRPDYETQIQAAARAEANARLRQQQLAESQAALQQAGIMAKSPALQTVGPRTLQPEQPAQMIQQPAQTITRNVSTQVPISYEDQSKRLTQYLIQQGARPETIAMVPQILETVGQRRPTTVEQVGDIGSIVRFGKEERFVPAKEANLENILKVRGLTVNFPEFQGQANTESEAKDFREQYATNLRLREQVADLLELTKLGKAQLQTPENKAKAQGLSRALKATMRKEILGEGVVTQPDQAILDAVIPDPTVLFSWPSANRTALENLVSRANSNLNIKAKSYGLQSISPRTGQAAAAPSGGVIRWNPVTKKLE